MGSSTVLVTGGAGYIGSHVVRQLAAKGDRVVVLDNLSSGHREAVLDGELVVGETGDQPLVECLLRDYAVDAVMHFAAHTVVPESVADPLKYYGNNTCQTRTLLAACAQAGIQDFIFSSTAAVYGIPATDKATEETPTAPINPYGTSKLMSEWMLRDLSSAVGLRYVILRYFNVAGADPQGRLGQSTPHATHLIKVASQVAAGVRDHIDIYGTDYPTADGTCVRDYIHVDDLAHAHLLALDYLHQGGEPITLNCGYGHGYSVRQVLDTVQAVSGQSLNIRPADRRPGDPPALVADAQRIRQILDWAPQYDDLTLIARTALSWERILAQRS